MRIPTLTLQDRTLYHHISIRKDMSYARKRHCSLNLLEISVLPIRKVKIGNTLETRGLTHSYTFCKNPKNALTGCKGTKESANTQTFFRLFAFLQLFAFPPNISAVVDNISSLSVTCGLHTSYILFTTEIPFIYRHFQKTLIYKNMPPVTY